MRRLIPIFLALTVFIAGSVPAKPPATATRWYYEIGGGEAITLAPNPGSVSVPFHVSLDLKNAFSCGKFNPTLGFDVAFQYLIERLKNLVMNALTAAAAAVPMYILQRANPGLYDLLQNLIFQIDGLLSLAAKSCEQMEREILAGKNPFDGWVTLSKSIDMKGLMGSGGLHSASTDILTALDTVENDSGSNGVPWIGGQKAGGQNQPPIRVVSDTTLAGYNTILGRDLLDLSDFFGAGDPPPLARIWSNPKQAQEFAVYVLGDIRIKTDQNDPSGSESWPGYGLAPLIEKDSRTIEETLAKLVQGELKPEESTLEKVSPPGTRLSQEVVSAIRRLPTDEARATAVRKLAAEAAVGKNLEKAIMLRKLLLSGRLEPNIYAAKPAQEDLDRLLAALDREIDSVLFETRVRRELYARTASVLMDLDVESADTASRVLPPPARDEQPVEEGGAVKKPGGNP